MLTALAAMLTVAAPASAQKAWPDRPVRLFVPVTAGGGLDLIARIVAQKVSEQVGQQIVVVNQGGASGTLASSTVARSDPDGYTFLFQSVSGAVAAPLMLKSLSFDPVNDFAPVSIVARFPLVLVVSPSIPAKNLNEFITLLRDNPGKYNYGSTGIGTSLYIAAELFKLQSKTDIVNIGYKGTADVLPDIFTGRVAMLIDGLPPELPNIQGGLVRALAVTSPTRSASLPDVPAMAEVLPGFDMPFWTGVFAPKRTPADIVERLSKEIAAAVRSPEISKRLLELGSEPVGSTPGELATYWRQQYELYRKIVQDANLEPK